MAIIKIKYFNFYVFEIKVIRGICLLLADLLQYPVKLREAYNNNLMSIFWTADCLSIHHSLHDGELQNKKKKTVS